MDYEKAYKEALKRARELSIDGYLDAIAIDELFSELKESEDERIRKWLMNLLCKMQYHHCDDEMEMGNKALAWLEKQQGGKDKFTQQHSLKEDSNVNDETNAPTEYGKYVDECLNEASKHFFSEGEDKYSVADLFYAGVRCGKSWLEKQGQKPYGQRKECLDCQFNYAGECKGSCAIKRSERKPTEWSEEDEKNWRRAIRATQVVYPVAADWLKFLKDKYIWKPSNEQMEVLLSEVNGWKKGCPKQIVLESLYNDLKKLK